MFKWKNYQHDPRNYFGRTAIIEAGPTRVALNSDPVAKLDHLGRNIMIATRSPQEYYSTRYVRQIRVS